MERWISIMLLGLLIFTSCRSGESEQPNITEPTDLESIPMYWRLRAAFFPTPEELARDKECDSLETLALRDVEAGKCTYVVHGTVEYSERLRRQAEAVKQQFGVALEYSCVWPFGNHCYTSAMNLELERRFGKEFYNISPPIGCSFYSTNQLKANNFSFNVQPDSSR